jgi:hypothetical protein
MLGGLGDQWNPGFVQRVLDLKRPGAVGTGPLKRPGLKRFRNQPTILVTRFQKASETLCASTVEDDLRTGAI